MEALKKFKEEGKKAKTKKKEEKKIEKQIAPYLGRTGDLPITSCPLLAVATGETEFFSRTLVPTELKKLLKLQA